jgi:hypothetical protein
MTSEIGLRIATAAQSMRDIVLRPTPTVGATGLAAADLAPAAGLDLAVIGGLAAVIAAVLALILHRRRGK